MQTAAASLVAAVPALLLAAFLVMGILNFGTGGGNIMFQVAVFGTLAAAVVVALLPGLIFVFWDRKRAARAADGGPSQTMVVPEDEAAVSVGDEDVEVMEADDTDVAQTVDFDSESVQAAAIDLDEEPGTDELDDSDLFVDEEEEEEAPKPKKKR